MLMRMVRPDRPEVEADARGVGAGNRAREEVHRQLVTQVRDRVVADLRNQGEISDPETIRRKIGDVYAELIRETGLVLGRGEREELLDRVVAEILGYGPLDTLLRDDTVTEIMVNGPSKIYVERRGKIERTPLAFDNPAHLMRIIERIVAPLGRRIDEASPMVDARLPDGSRVNAIIPPLSLVGPVLTIRKFSRVPLGIEDLIRLGTCTAEFMDFMKACVVSRLNVVVSGGTGSGKTTLLGVLSSFIPGDDRIVTIEDAAELQLRQEHVVTLEARPPNLEGKGQISIRQLVINALRMRPDRIVVGEVRGSEALDMLQAMNTGHDGSLTTAHSNGARDTIRRLETMVLMAGMDLPLRAIREQVASAINLIVHVQRMRDGTRKIVQVSEVAGMEGDTILLQDIFLFKDGGMRDDKLIGGLEPTGVRPKFMEKIQLAGLQLKPEIFGYTMALRR
ncbi:MAG TPA: CpaF family protein [Anaerolineae bacterium]|nr:CpaF family protein [Anaerolineae bacterium]HPL29343.1 CpaF family protein [Anaerolineae bacterium]